MNLIRGRYQPRLIVPPILKVVENVGPARFEKLHNMSKNKIFMFHKDAVEAMLEFECVCSANVLRRPLESAAILSRSVLSTRWS